MKKYKMISYNSHSGKNLWMLPRLEQIIFFLKNEQIDIIAIQEIHQSKKMGLQVSKIKNELNINVHFGPHLFFAEGQYGIATFVKASVILRKHILLPYKKEYRGFLDTFIKLDENLIHVLNTHLSLDAYTRINQIKKIQEQLGALKHPFIMMGDFNTSLTKIVEIDVARIMNKIHIPTVMYSKKRIDHIYVSKDIEIVDYKVIPVKFSDHFPVVAEFTFNN